MTRWTVGFLFLFAGIGWIAGRIAQATVKPSIAATTATGKSLPTAVEDDRTGDR